MSAHVIGLTGQSGAGKTTVSSELLLHGFYHIDCDVLTHMLLRPDTDCIKAIKAHFPQFFTDGNFDRRKAAPLLFSDKALLERYNSVIFPFITHDIKEMISYAESHGHELILLDAPTLFEAGADSLCEMIVACIADIDIRLERIMERDGIDRQAAAARFKSQHDDAFFRERADIIIENNGSYADLVKSAQDCAKEITNRINRSKRK